jgi:threonine synthase
MKYVSTRGEAPVVGFSDVLLAGLARDGGLYVPDSWPEIPADLPASLPASYAGAAAAVMAPFVDGFPDFESLVAAACAEFDHPDVCPLVELEPGVHLLELFHGPTLAFKDVALQLVGRLFDAELERRDERVTILVATSGDTGSAAIEACVGRRRLDIVVLHPAGRVSDVQRRQMTTVDAPNVHNLAVDGTFDDCQDIVKALLADESLRQERSLSAMNSINWARVLPQVPYYVRAARAVGPCDVAVPTGNFGNVLAAWYARRLGAPIERLVVGSNRNDILTRWLDTGVLESREVVPTISPSMDIQVSSNLERLLFELLDRDGGATAELVAAFRRTGRVDAPRDPAFVGTRVDDDDTRDEIGRVYAATGVLVDPHTAVGLRAAASHRSDRPVICAATAHPAKFPDAVAQATGVRPPVPERLAHVLDRPERCTRVPADTAAVRAALHHMV